MLTGHGDDRYRYGHVRLNFSSNIYGHADMEPLKQFLCSHIDAIGSYPEPEPYAARRAIARWRGVSEECVLVTNGATEAIYLIAQMLRSEGFERFSVHDPTFSEYRDASQLAGLRSAPFGVSEPDARCVAWLCNPNNPTGHVYPQEEVERLARHYGMLVVDQSYEDYTLQPLMPPAMAITSENIILIYSLTKTCAVPGLRIGYVVARAEIIARLRRYVRPWSVGTLSSLAAEWLADHDVRAVADRPALLAEAARLSRRLSQLPGISVVPSATTFMLVRCEQMTSAELKERLVRRYGILVRDASNFRKLDNHYIRVATQRPEDNDQLVAACGLMHNG